VSLILRNSDGEDKWDKIIVGANSPEQIDEYYRRLPDKRLFDIARVVLIEESDSYVVIKNIWKYEDEDIIKCRDLKGRYFEIKDIEFVKVFPRDYVNKRMLQEDDIPSNIIIMDLKNNSL